MAVSNANLQNRNRSNQLAFSRSHLEPPQPPLLREEQIENRHQTQTQLVSDGDAQTVRIYFNLSPDGAVAVMGAITQQLNEIAIPFKFLGNAPATLPQKCWKPSIPDLYRYSLMQNGVDVCLTGMKRREEIDAAIAGVQQGKLTPAEIDYLNVYGDLHRDRLKIQDVPPERLIYQA